MPLQRRHRATVLISIFFCLSCQTGTLIFHLLPLMPSYRRTLRRRSHQLLEVRSSLFRCSFESREDVFRLWLMVDLFEDGSWDKFLNFHPITHQRSGVFFLGWGRIATKGLVNVCKASIVTGDYAAILLKEASRLIVWWYSRAWSKYQFSFAPIDHSHVFKYR